MFKKIGLATIISVLFVLFINWACFPAWSFEGAGAWTTILFTAIIFAGIVSICDTFDYDLNEEISKVSIAAWIITGIIALAFLFLACAGGRLFNAYRYQRQISVSEADFATDMPEENISSLALMDTDSAIIYGKRELGAMPAEMISVYEGDDNYATISFQGKPLKVAPLKYAGVLKANKNKYTGIPGYIKVDPVTYEAEYVKLDKNMLYTPSSVFSYKLSRHIHSQYPSFIQGRTFFELDEEGQPWFTVQHISHKIGTFGGKTVVGLFIVNPFNGEIQYYNASEVPEWIDIVYDGDYISEKYNDFGQFGQGYWNSVFTQQGCKVVTDDFGYKVIGNDVFIYTGVTSKASDESNVGFILTNGRTMETKYYSVVGAEEYSAMGAAEGEVQQYGYKGSFPSLVNVEGQPTYVLVLKDENGLVKKISMVNVEHYDIVAVEDNLNKVRSSYLKLLAQRGVTGSATDDLVVVDTVVEDIEFVALDGQTVVYIKTADGCFKSDFDESFILLDVEDEVNISYYKSGQAIEVIDTIK